MTRWAIGIDLGGTNARAAVVSSEGHMRASVKRPLADRSPAAVVEAIALAAESAIQNAQVQVEACGVGAAAMLDESTGMVLVGPNLGWRNVPLGSLLTQRLARPVKIINDLKVAAWGELKAGAARGSSEVLVVFVGSGVGSALIVKGQMLKGAGGVAGELGHIKVVPSGRLCGCGERGCLEAYAGGHNLIAQMREVASPAMLELAGGDPNRFTPAILEQAAQAGDPASREILHRASDFLGLAVANLVTVLNPRHLILGGGVLGNLAGMRERVVQTVNEQATRLSRQGLLIANAALGDDSGLIGAGLLALER
jgi:glucokinase